MQSSMNESKFITLVGARYSVKMRRLGVLTRIKYFQFHFKYREIRLQRVLKYLQGRTPPVSDSSCRSWKRILGLISTT
jgi:hypothetical protein